MSWYYPTRGPRKAADGIRFQTTSLSANSRWGRLWMDALTIFTLPTRLERGLRYAKAGQVLSMSVEHGYVTATVQGSRARPYTVEIGLPMFSRAAWMRVADALAKKSFALAKLLAGEMPPEIDRIFRAAGAALFPSSPADISTDCSCPDLENPCKHITAAYFILGQEFDRDPFLLFTMRGLGREQLLVEIQTRRNTGPRLADKTSVKPASPERSPQTVLSDRLNNFYQAPRPLTWTMEPGFLEHLPKPGSRIHELGTPPFWQSEYDFEDVLTKMIQAIRKRALEHDEGPH